MSGIGRRARVGTGLLVLAALSLGRVLTEWLPGADRAERPFATEVSVGEVAHLRTGEVRVTRVHGSAAVTEIGSTMRSPGVWVVVDYTWTPSNASTGLLGVAVRGADGQRWLAGVSRNVQSCGASVPGLPIRCQAAVELPPDLVPGARLELSADSYATEYDSMALVPLGVDRAGVEGWLAVEDPIDIAQPEVGAS